MPIANRTRTVVETQAKYEEELNEIEAAIRLFGSKKAVYVAQNKEDSLGDRSFD